MREIFEEEHEDDIYNEQYLELYVEDDKISGEEAEFMMRYLR